jgi:hypothetical protein
MQGAALLQMRLMQALHGKWLEEPNQQRCWSPRP